jgi:hypothetical protein
LIIVKLSKRFQAFPGRLLLALASIVILDSEFHGTHGRILLSHDSGSLETHVRACLPTYLPATLLLALDSRVILGSKSQETHDHILLPDESGSLQQLSDMGLSGKLLLVLASTDILGSDSSGTHVHHSTPRTAKTTHTR